MQKLTIHVCRNCSLQDLDMVKSSGVAMGGGKGASGSLAPRCRPWGLINILFAFIQKRVLIRNLD